MNNGLLEHRPTFAHVDLGALRRNFEAFRGYASPSKVMGVVKANGYGHGLVQVAQTLQNAGIDFLGVAYVEEALELRRNGISIPILVFAGLLEEQLRLYIENDIDVAASSVSKLEQIEVVAKHLGKRARVHLKIDTGLERIGVHYYSAQSLFDAALRCPSCDVVGVYSHFAAVTMDDLALGKLQLERFLEATAQFATRAPHPFLRHIAASSGILAIKESHLDMVRPGLSLYGVYPGPGFSKVLPLEPVLTLQSKVVYFKVVREGAGVSYGHTWHAPRDTRIITVPIGYGDGYTRQLSNRASVLIRGKRHPIVGVVCMDQLMVDIGPDGTAYNGDDVVLVGSQDGERISIEDLATLISTTPHELLVSLNQRIPRIYSEASS